MNTCSLIIVVLHGNQKNQKTKNVRTFLITILRYVRSWKCKICFHFRDSLLLTPQIFFSKITVYAILKIVKFKKNGKITQKPVEMDR